MNTILIINISLAVIFIIALVVMWFKGKREFVKNIIKGLVKVAEEYFSKGKNKEKLYFVLDNILKITNKIWILKIYLTRERLIKWIEESVEYMQLIEGTTSEKENVVKKIAVELAKSKIQEYTDKIVKSDYYGDKYLIDNWKAIDLKKEVLQTLDDDFEGIKVKIDTGFTKKTTKAGVEIVKRF